MRIVLFFLLWFIPLNAMKLSVSKEVSHAEEPVSIFAYGGEPFEEYRISMTVKDCSGTSWESFAYYTADDHGKIFVDYTPAIDGTYAGVDGMGLFSSMQSDALVDVPFKSSERELIYYLHLWDRGRRVDSIKIKRTFRNEEIKMTDEAVFAGGCFWCMEPVFDSLEGVISVESGYTGGSVAHPSYEEVCQGGTGHLEAIRIVYDPSKISYEQLLDIFWHNIDPVDPYGQFCDKGEQYLSAVFYKGEKQLNLVRKSKEEITKALKGKPIYTQIRPLEIFYPAESYHQKFYQTDPDRYQSYRSCCRRDERLKELWG